MRSALVLGTGRSGTSMVTGALAQAGYFQGEALHAARASNPRGFFEAPEVNAINEALLAPLLPERCGLGPGQRWLGVPRPGARPAADAELAARMRRLVAREPFCFKDPRFSFTLPAWRALLPRSVGLVCVFRHPALSATSLVAECASAGYLAGVSFDLDNACELWSATYRAVLSQSAESAESAAGEWLFVHYDQMLAPEGRARLAAFLGAEVSGAFPDAKLRRRTPEVEVPAEALELYAELCARAGHAEPARASVAEPRVTVLAWIGPGDEEHVPALIEDAGAQRGVRAELVLLDGTEHGFDGRGARVRAGTWSRCRDLRRAALEADTDFVALAVPGARSLSARLSHALERLGERGVDLVSADYVLTDEHGRFVERVSPAAMGDVPGPCFEAGLVARRELFAELPEAAFFPGELALFRRARASKRTAHVLEPAFTLERRRYTALWDRAQDDAALVTLAARPAAQTRPERPELSVSLCTWDRRAILRACLESFARQRVPPGTFEIVLTDDGSRDGTAERLAELELAIPLTSVSQANAGLSAARNAGLARARGRLVLFVNDDTLAFPDLVERHLARHAALGGERAAVLGTFEQPPQAMRHALTRWLEGSSEVFDYASLRALERYDGFRFWTCNVSVALSAVRSAGGFDESFRHYGCEDADLGFRLGCAGLRVVYDPAARAQHLHAMEFDYVKKRARGVARAYARLVRKHPGLLAAWGNERLTARHCERELHRHAELQREREDAARELARLDDGALRDLGGPWAALADEVQERLGELVPELNRLWWCQGYLDGFAEHGLAGFDELIAGGLEPWPIASANERVLLAWPRWDDAGSLDSLLERVAPLATDGFAVLLLRRDPLSDPSHEEALAALQAAWARRFGGSGDLEVLLEEAPLGRPEVARLARSVSAFLPLGGEPPEFLAAVGTERLVTTEAVRAWRERFEGETTAEARRTRRSAEEDQGERKEGDDGSAKDGAPSAALPELSVIVPAHERPRELLQLLEALAAQDLAPARFEVLVVDDGSQRSAASLLEGRSFPFELQCLAQPQAGPAAARNRGLARARGALVVFLNDDAVPAHDCLRRHLAAHALSDEPRAVLGTFRTLPAHLRDSFALWVEGSGALFAQPHMKAGVRYHGLALCTGNLSLRRALLAEGFDESLAYAGGEDSELGLRLEREHGLAVVFDPRVQAGHDHGLEPASFAARRRAVGWTSYHIDRRHAGARLVPVEDWPACATEVEAESAEREALVARLSAIQSEEHAGARPRGKSAEVPALVTRLSELEFRHGALLAWRGLCPGAAGELEGPAALAPARSGSPGRAGASLASALLRVPPTAEDVRSARA